MAEQKTAPPDEPAAGTATPTAEQVKKTDPPPKTEDGSQGVREEGCRRRGH